MNLRSPIKHDQRCDNVQLDLLSLRNYMIAGKAGESSKGFKPVLTKAGCQIKLCDHFCTLEHWDRRTAF